MMTGEEWNYKMRLAIMMMTLGGFTAFLNVQFIFDTVIPVWGRIAVTIITAVCSGISLAGLFMFVKLRRMIQ